jgi:hypothetical protein
MVHHDHVILTTPFQCGTLATCYLSLHRQAYLMDGGTDLRVFVNHETVRGDEL